MSVMKIFETFQKMKECNNQVLITVNDEFPNELNQFLHTLPNQQLLVEEAKIEWLEQDAKLTVSGQNNAIIPIKGLSTTSFEFTQVVLQFSQETQNALIVFQFSFNGYIKTTKQSFSCTGQLIKSNSLLISTIENAAEPLTLSNTNNLVNIEDIIEYLPFEKQMLEAIPLKSLQVLCETGAMAQTTLLMEMQLPNEWNINGGLLPLRNVRIGLQTTYTQMENGNLRTSFGGRIQSTVHLGQDFETIIYCSGGDVLHLEVIPQDGNILPGLAELAALVGGQNLENSFEQALKQMRLEDFAIQRVGISFNTDTKNIINIGIASSLKLGELELQVVLSLPDFNFSGGLAKGTNIDIASIIRHFFDTAEGYPSIDITGFVITASPSQNHYSLYLEVTDDWKLSIGSTELSLSQVEVELDIASLQASASSGKTWLATGFVNGVVRIGETELFMRAERDITTQKWTFSGGIETGSTIRLYDIAKHFLPDGESFPEEIPDVTVTELLLAYTIGTGAFTLDAKITADWELPFGARDLTVSTATLHISREANEEGSSGKIHSEISINSQGPATIVDNLVFQSLDFKFVYDQGQSWNLSGSVDAKLFDAEYILSASLLQSITERKFSLIGERKSDTPLIKLDEIGSLDAKKMSIQISKMIASNTRTLDNNSVALNSDSMYTWSLTAEGNVLFNLITHLEVAGKVQIFSEKQKAGLIFKAENSDLSILLPVVGEDITTHLELDAISVIRNEEPNGEPWWSFDASASVWFNNLPQKIAKNLPKRFNGSFVADKQGVQISINRILDPIEISIPDAQAGDIHIELGTALLDASNFALGLKSNHLFLSMDIGIGLPEKLNNVFGKTNDNTPKHNIFRTYHHDDNNSVTKLRLSIDTDNGLALQPITSPFEAIKFVTEGTKTYCECCLGKDGEFGEFKFQLPTLSYDGSSFAASGGFEQKKPLKLPLSLLKTLFNRSGLQKINDLLPDTITFQEIDVFDDDGHIYVDEFVQHLEKQGGFSLPSEFTDALHIINKSLDKLPDYFKKYFNIKIPDGFNFDIKIGADGSVRIKAAVKGDAPIRFMIPIMGLLGPEVMGIELYSITFGEVLGGALLLLNADIRIDRYDFITLAASMVLPDSAQKVLPDTRKLVARITIKDLFMLIFYEAGIPIPIPLFIDELSYQHLGIEGVDLKFSLNFPKPQFSATEIMELFKQFQNFFTKKDFLLDTKVKPENVDLVLTLGPNYLQLPKYLGEKLLGSRTDQQSISAYECMASLLNFLKTLSLNSMIQSIPLDKRIGKENVSLACLSMEASWLLTTPYEFVKGEYKQLQLVEEEANTLLQVLPTSPDPNQQGVVLFLAGDWAVKDVASLKTYFGLVGTYSGFATGIHISGAISHVLDIELKGHVVISPKEEETFSIVGHSHMTIFDKEIFKGDLAITNNSFAVDGKLDLFPDSPLLRITGMVTGRISDQELYVYGEISAIAGKTFTLASAIAEITHEHVKLIGTWLNQTVTFIAQKVNNSLQLKATIAPINVLEVLKISGYGSDTEPYALLCLGSNQSVELKISGKICLLDACLESEISFGEKGFSFSLHGRIFDFAEASLEAHGDNLLDGQSINVLSTFQQDFFDYISKEAVKIIRTTVEANNEKLQDAISEINSAKEAMDLIDVKINERRIVAKKNYDDAASVLSDKQYKIDKAQEEVNSIDILIQQRREVAIRNFEEATSALRNKQHELEKVKMLFDQLQHEIVDHKRAIKKLKKELYNPKAWVEITWHETQIKALELTQKTAGLELEAVKQAFELANKTINIVPVESDPELLALIASRQTATAALTIAQQELELAKQTVKLVPVEADPQLLALYTSRETAEFTLNRVKDILKAAQEANKAFEQAASFAASFGWGNFLVIKSASFSGLLNGVKDGSVKLQVTALFMNKQNQYEFDFSFHNPLDSVTTWVNTLEWK